MLKAGGTVEEYEAKANSVKASLRQELRCFSPACELTVLVTAGSVILTVFATDTSEGGSQVESAAKALQTKDLDAISSVLGVTIEEPPAVPLVIDVEVHVTRLAPSPPPPSSPLRSPPPPCLPPPSLPPLSPPPPLLPPQLQPPPLSPPTPPSSSPTAISEGKANSQGAPSVPLWLVLLVVLVLVVLLFVVLIVLCYRRMSRNHVNLRISRDRANLDLQMISHQVQIRVQTQSDGSVSLPDSLPAKWSMSLAKAPTASLPPGPPSSSAGQSVAEREVTRPGAAGSGVVPTVPALLAAPTVWPFPSASCWLLGGA